MPLPKSTKDEPITPEEIRDLFARIVWGASHKECSTEITSRQCEWLIASPLKYRMKDLKKSTPR